MKDKNTPKTSYSVNLFSSFRPLLDTPKTYSMGSHAHAFRGQYLCSSLYGDSRLVMVTRRAILEVGNESTDPTTWELNLKNERQGDFQKKKQGKNGNFADRPLNQSRGT